MILLFSIIVPLVVGTICAFFPSRWRFLQEGVGLAVAIFEGLVSLLIVFSPPVSWGLGEHVLFSTDALNRVIGVAIAGFGILIILYSSLGFQNLSQKSIYYASLLWTLGGAFGVIWSSHWIGLMVFWGFLGIPFYFLILTGDQKAPWVAQRSLLMIAGSDVFMILGIALVYRMTSQFEMKVFFPLSGSIAYLAVFCFIIATYTKAGAMPFHSWIPFVAETAPLSVTAFLPASLDKLLGIYVLARIVLDVFYISFGIQMFLLVTGTLTVLGGVFMALVQHDFRRLLAFHAISQVGYMLIGIGTGNPIGIAGGIFHMLNNAMYKSALFLCGGNVFFRTGKTHLDTLGNLAPKMPLTFTAFLISAFAISGIPPLNGFVSKWMIYQGLIVFAQSGTDPFWWIWLVSALLGSGLTLASFMKLTHSIFLGESSIQKRKIREAPATLWIPPFILAAGCILLGVLAQVWILPYCLGPVVNGIEFLGFWAPGSATGLILTGIVLGILLYFIGKKPKIRKVSYFIGGEEDLPLETRITGVRFYDTIREFPIFRSIYLWAEASYFDVYEQGRRGLGYVGEKLRLLHSGILNQYAFWLVFGTVVLLLFLFGR